MNDLRCKICGSLCHLTPDASGDAQPSNLLPSLPQVRFCGQRESPDGSPRRTSTQFMSPTWVMSAKHRCEQHRSRRHPCRVQPFWRDSCLVVTMDCLSDAPRRARSRLLRTTPTARTFSPEGFDRHRQARRQRLRTCQWRSLEVAEHFPDPVAGFAETLNRGSSVLALPIAGARTAASTGEWWYYSLDSDRDMFFALHRQVPEASGRSVLAVSRESAGRDFHILTNNTRALSSFVLVGRDEPHVTLSQRSPARGSLRYVDYEMLAGRG